MALLCTYAKHFRLSRRCFHWFSHDVCSTCFFTFSADNIVLCFFFDLWKLIRPLHLVSLCMTLHFCFPPSFLTVYCYFNTVHFVRHSDTLTSAWILLGPKDAEQVKYGPYHCTPNESAFWQEMVMSSPWLDCWPEHVTVEVLHVLLLLLTQHPVVIFRHRSHRPPEPRPSRGKQQTDPADGEWCREPQAKHRTCFRDRWLLRHPALRPSQRPIGGRDQSVGRGGLRGLRVSNCGENVWWYGRLNSSVSTCCGKKAKCLYRTGVVRCNWFISLALLVMCQRL